MGFKRYLYGQDAIYGNSINWIILNYYISFIIEFVHYKTTKNVSVDKS